MNCTCQWKILDWYWARNLFTYRFPSVKTTEYSSSSSWWSTSRRRWSDEILENKRSSSEPFCAFSTLVWWKVGRASWQEAEATRKDFSIVLILQEKFFTSDFFKVIQDAILLIQNCRTMFLFRTMSSSTFSTSDVQSIYTPSRIPGGQNVSNRQTVFFLHVNPMDKEHKDPDTIDLGAPRLAQYMHKAWKKHQNTVYWVDINLAQMKGLKFYQARSNGIILYNILPACCIPKVVRMETGEVIVFFLPVDPLNKEHRDPDVIDLEAPRLAWYKQKTWKKHQITVFGRHQTCSRERN